MQLKIINPLEDNRWDAYAINHKAGTIFHTSHWARVIEKTYGFTPFYCILEDPGGKIVAGVPFFLIKDAWRGRRLICLPFTDSCSPLINGEQVVEPLIKGMISLFNDHRFSSVEIRSGTENHMLQKLHMKDNNYYKLFRLDLSGGIESLWRGFKQKSIRYPIRKALSKKLVVDNTQDIKDIQAFYTLNVLTRKKHGIIPQPYRFFANIFHEMIAKGHALLFIARFENRPVAGSIFFLDQKTMYYKFNASDHRYLSLQPNSFLVWQAVQYGCNKGLRYLDFGRTAPDNKGLMSFKRHWGAEEIDMYYFYKPAAGNVSGIRESSLKYRMVTSVLRNMPAPFLKKLGDIFYGYFA